MRHAGILTDALRSLGESPARSLLTAFGVTVGVTAVVTLTGLVEGLGGYVRSQFESMLDSRAFEISRRSPGFEDAEQMRESRSWPALDADLAEDLADMTTTGTVAWSAMSSGSVTREGITAEDVTIRGLSPSTEVVSPLELAAGRSFTESEDVRRSRVCVLGSGIAEALGMTGDDLGSDLVIGGHRFHPIGIEEPEGSMMGIELDDRVSIPYSTFESLFGRPGSDLRITVLPDAGVTLEACREEVRSILRRLRGLTTDEDDNFHFVTQEGALSSLGEVLAAVATLTIGIAAVSLLVGGIGIMNITLVSVAERTREIGTRRALGATRGDIVFQFLAEAVAVSVLGGLAGLAAGAGLIAVAARITPLPARVTGWSVAVALGFSIVVGVLFGVFPAWMAARLHPAEALRHE